MIKKKYLLIVEDEWILWEELCAFFIEKGFDVAPFTDNYEAALLLVRERTPDLAIVDIKLNFRKAAEDGVMLAKKLKNDYSIPVMFLSAHNDEETLIRIKSIHSQHFIVKTKPLNKEQKEQLYTSVQLGIPNEAENR